MVDITAAFFIEEETGFSLFCCREVKGSLIFAGYLKPEKRAVPVTFRGPLAEFLVAVISSTKSWSQKIPGDGHHHREANSPL